MQDNNTVEFTFIQIIGIAVVLKNGCAFCFKEQGETVLLSQYLSFIFSYVFRHMNLVKFKSCKV